MRRVTTHKALRTTPSAQRRKSEKLTDLSGDCAPGCSSLSAACGVGQALAA